VERVSIKQYLRKPFWTRIDAEKSDLSALVKACLRVAFEELDQWIWRKLRSILWRQWKTPRTRAGEMIERGIEKAAASTSAYNGRGPWWNAGASHMNAAVTAKWLQQQGLMSLLAGHRRFTKLA
jgi:RNA-directed DNA polymerase